LKELKIVIKYILTNTTLCPLLGGALHQKLFGGLLFMVKELSLGKILVVRYLKINR